MEYITYLVPALAANEIKVLANPQTTGTISEFRFQDGQPNLLVKLGSGARVQQTLVGGTGEKYTSLSVACDEGSFISVQNLSDRLLMPQAIVIGK